MAVRRPLSRVKARLTLAFDTRGLDRSLKALDDLVANPALIAQLLRNAVAETLLAAYRQRFLANFEQALDPHPVNGNGAPRVESTAARSAKDTLAKAYESLTKATAKNDQAGMQLARQQIARAEDRLVQHSVRRSGPSNLSTGQFRELALQVLQTMTDASLIAVDVELNQVSVGLLHMPTLEQAATPSATPKLTGQRTSSSYTTLWRQLEFGTGIYAKAPGVGSRSPQGWWYGPRPGFGLQLLGSEGVHAVFDAATGLPYQRDALEFEQVFAGMLGRALAGR